MPPLSFLAQRWRHLRQRYQQALWQPRRLARFSPRSVLYASLRVISITWTVFNETKAASRAAALSFSSLLGLGPLVALTVLVAGFALDNKDPDLAAHALSRLINFIAPQVGQYSKLPDPPARPDGTTDATTPTESAAPVTDDDAPATPALTAANPDLAMNPRLVRMMNNFISQGRSGSAGTLGFLSLVLIVLLLFKTVEDTFNEIWGVRSGRSVLKRIVYYWTILTLGAVLFFASVTLLSAGAFIGVFHETINRLPFSQQVNSALQWSLPAFSFALLVVLLTLFYRFIPHTRVYWRAAVAGAVVVASLLMLNNYLAFLYVRRVILTESLYGSLGFPLVVMFGLYIFWLYVLIGGQISYAVQNVNFRNSQAAWNHISHAKRERLLLVVLLTICRRFRECLPPVTATQLGDTIKIPTQILNECLNRLVDLKLITSLPPAEDDDASDPPYQPALPLNRITLREFKQFDDTFGEDPVGNSLEDLDPLLARYTRGLDRLTSDELYTKNLEQLLDEYPSAGSRPPFADDELPENKTPTGA